MKLSFYEVYEHSSADQAKDGGTISRNMIVENES